MIRRLFLLTVGIGAGAVLGVVAVRKLEATRRRYTPQAVAGATAARAGGLRERLAVAVGEGRRAAEAKEAELRAVYRVNASPEPPTPEPPFSELPPPDPR